LENNIILVCADSVNEYDAVASMMKSIYSMPYKFFSGAILFTDLIREKEIRNLYNTNILVQNIPKISSVKEYSKFIMKDMPKLIEMSLGREVSASHYLIVQHDSWIVNPGSWTNDFLKYDYIGAPLCCHPRDVVMNGGFSLRSKRLCDLVASCNEITELDDDCSICRTYRNIFERNGMIFAPPVTASKFAVEGRPIINQFGQHACGNGVYLGFDNFDTGRDYKKREVFICPPSKVFPRPSLSNPDAYAYTVKDPEKALELVNYEYTLWYYRDLGIDPPGHPSIVWDNLKNS